MSIIPSGLFAKYDEFTQHFLDDFGCTCTLLYNETIAVINTEQPTLKQKKSIEILPGNTGFSRGDVSYKTVQNTDTIRLRVYWTAKEFKKISSIDLPEGSIACYGLLSDLPKIERASKLIIYPSSTPDHREWLFEKNGEPKIHGLTFKELITIWKRIDG